jgi:TetR/AcrR family transcriptional repressor of nem operon
MPREKAFVEEEVLDRALILFWQHGYEATSVRDLVADLGISSSSLYATFGDKKAIYGAVLARYRAVEREQFHALLQMPAALRPLVWRMFSDLLDFQLADGGQRGSFTLNAAVEWGGRDPVVAAQLRAHFEDLAGLLTARLAAAQAAGEISGRLAAADQARFLLFGLFGLAAIVRIYPDRAHLEHTAGLIMAILDF